MSDLLLDIYLWGESLKTWPPLLSAVVGGIIVAVAEPLLRLWYQKQIREHKELKKLTEIAKGDGPEGYRQFARDELAKRTKKTIKTAMKILVLFAAGFTPIYFFLSNAVDESHSKLRMAYQEYINSLDDSKELLKLKTIKKPIQTVCRVGAIRDIERTRSERICLLEGSSPWNDEGREDRTNRLVNAEVYEVCMAKRGWRVRECQEGDTECMILRTGRGCCDQTRLKTEPENISIQCLEAEKEETAIARWEFVCSRRAEIEGEYKAQNDRDKIGIMSRSYQACMLEQGWLARQCSTSEQGCVEIAYTESTCIRRIREWLERGGDPSNFLGCLEKGYD